jgi:hypothetical protein
MPRRGAVAISLGLMAVLLALSGFVCSPWHKHSRLPGQTCSFSAFEHAPGVQAAAHHLLPPPEPLLWQDTSPRPVSPCLGLSTAHAGRAPPA